MKIPRPIAWLAFAGAVMAAWGKDALAVSQKRAPTPTNTLDGLQPEFRDRIESFIFDVEVETGIRLRVDETFRTYLRETWLWEAYDADRAHAPVAAPPGQSRHGRGLAADLWPEGKSYTDTSVALLLDNLAPIAAKHGLKNLGHIGDHDHFEDI